MPLTVLSDDDVRNLLLQLTKQDILDLQQSLADALHHYSTATDEDASNGCSSSYQPLRTSLKRGDGQTTLFMPATSNDGMGVKIVTLAGSDDSVSKSSSTTTDTPPHSLSSAQSTSPKGSLTLFDESGAPRALLNAEEITAFRTALASTMLFKKRQNVHDVVVFGAGKQAFWHIRLALLLRGDDIHHLNIINRDSERVHQLLSKLYTPTHHQHQDQHQQSTPKTQPTPPYPTENESNLPQPKIQILTPHDSDYNSLLKSTVRASTVIFFTTPSLTPLFPAPYLTDPPARKKGRYLAAIGSYTPHMVEIHPDIVKGNVESRHFDTRIHTHTDDADTATTATTATNQPSAIIVDSTEACLKEAGEIIQARLGRNQMVEIGQLLLLKRDAEMKRAACCNVHRLTEQGLDEHGVELRDCEPLERMMMKMMKTGADENENENENEVAGAGAGAGAGSGVVQSRRLLDWLQRGNVIYKSVGLGLMDVQVGMDLVRLADERGIGTRIENF